MQGEIISVEKDFLDWQAEGATSCFYVSYTNTFTLHTIA